MKRLQPLALALLLPMGACVSSPSEGPMWWQEIAADLGTKLGGCTIGDLDPFSSGNEIGLVAGDGRVFCLRRDGKGWSQELIAELPGEQIQCVACDLLPDFPGDELVTIGVASGSEEDGARGAAWVHWTEAGRWRSKMILDDDALLHAVAFGDVDANRPGDELLLAGFSGRVHVLHEENGELVSESFGPLPGNVKGAAAGLGGVVLACDDGSLCAMRRGGDGWQLEILEHFQAPLARVDARPTRALVCSNDGRLNLVDGGGVQAIEVSADRLRGAVFVDIDPLVPGDELATTGYDGRIVVISLTRAEEDDPAMGVHAGDPVVRLQSVAREDGRMHHLAAGTLAGLGTCLVACGYTGRVVVVGRLK